MSFADVTEAIKEEAARLWRQGGAVDATPVDAIAMAIHLERQKHDLPTSPDLQAEAERVFADVQRAVLVEDAIAVIDRALWAAVKAERKRCLAIIHAENEWGGDIAGEAYEKINAGSEPRFIEGWSE